MNFNKLFSEKAVKLDFDINSVEIYVSKHFKNKYMYMWNWDYKDLRKALKDAHTIKKEGNEKYEAFVNWRGSKKIIFVFYKFENQIFVISGSEGD